MKYTATVTPNGNIELRDERSLPVTVHSPASAYSLRDALSAALEKLESNTVSTLHDFEVH